MKKAIFNGEQVFINNNNLVVVKRGYCYFLYELYEEAVQDDLLKMNRIYYGQYITYSRRLKDLENIKL